VNNLSAMMDWWLPGREAPALPKNENEQKIEDVKAL
jgi:hypothetical protein